MTEIVKLISTKQKYILITLLDVISSNEKPKKTIFILHTLHYNAVMPTFI